MARQQNLALIDYYDISLSECVCVFVCVYVGEQAVDRSLSALPQVSNWKEEHRWAGEGSWAEEGRRGREEQKQRKWTEAAVPVV